MKGKLITIEGPDGAGKSTQVKKIAENLKERGYQIFVTREPGGTQIGEQIRDILLDNKNINMAFKTEVLLYAAARAQLITEFIEPALKEGKIVICDRFFDSSIAYQGYGRNIDLEYVEKINYSTIKNCFPDLTILLDLPVEEGLKRVKKNKNMDRLESEKIDFHKRVREGFLKLKEKEPERIKLVSASNNPDIVFKNMLKLINETLKV